MSEMVVFHPVAFRDQFHPDTTSYLGGYSADTHNSFAQFRDPDGWFRREVESRHDGDTDSAPTSFASASDLADALRRAEAAHAEHEKRTGEAAPNRHDWYAEYMLAEQRGTELST